MEQGQGASLTLVSFLGSLVAHVNKRIQDLTRGEATLVSCESILKAVQAGYPLDAPFSTSVDPFTLQHALNRLSDIGQRCYGIICVLDENLPIWDAIAEVILRLVMQGLLAQQNLGLTVRQYLIREDVVGQLTKLLIVFGVACVEQEGEATSEEASDSLCDVSKEEAGEGDWNSAILAIMGDPVLAVRYARALAGQKFNEEFFCLLRRWIIAIEGKVDILNLEGAIDEAEAEWQATHPDDQRINHEESPEDSIPEGAVDKRMQQDADYYLILDTILHSPPLRFVLLEAMVRNRHCQAFFEALRDALAGLMQRPKLGLRELDEALDEAHQNSVTFGVARGTGWVVGIA